MKDFVDFVWAVVNNWAGYATGGFIVAFLWIFFVWRDKPMPRTVAIALALLFLLMAFFKAWRDQRDASVQNVREVKNLQKLVEELTKSEITGDINYAILGAQSYGSHAALVVSLFNRGADSAFDPSSWSLEATLPDGKTYAGEPITLVGSLISV